EVRKCFEDLLRFCQKDESKFHRFEPSLFKKLFALGRLLVLVWLLSRNRRLRVHYNEQKYRVGQVHAERKLQTVFGEVTYGRLHLRRRRGGGCGYHPLDVALGLSRDGFSPMVISFVTRLATRVSYDSARLICQQAWGWSPSTETLHALVLGLGRHAHHYVEAGQWWRRRKKTKQDGEVLVIEADGKCPPTATEAELEKRRGPRQGCPYCCQRHRGQNKRKQRGPKRRRKKGDKSKNGKEAMVIVMYTLRRGTDGLLHGPINKKVWGTFAGRRAAAEWARAEATRRGFPPNRNGDVQVLVDGANGLEHNLRRLFDGAIFTLDVRHVEERIWTAGRAFHREASPELAAWVKERRQLLYERRPSAFLAWLQAEQQSWTGRRGGRGRVQALQKLIDYVQPRLSMLNYAMLKRKDLVLASGQVE